MSDSRNLEKVAILERLIEEKSRELYRAKLEIEEKNRFLEQVIHTMPSGLWVFDSTGTLELVNQRGCEMAALSREQLRERRFQDLFPEIPESPCNSGACSTSVETRLRQTDAATLPVWLNASRLTASSGGRIVATAVDLTDQKRLEGRLRIAQKLEAVGQLAAGVAHEVNTPMQFIGDGVVFLRDCLRDLLTLVSTHDQVFAELASADALSPEQRQRLADASAQADLEFVQLEATPAVERTLRGVDRVADIVRALKAFAHPGDGSFSPSDLNATVRDAAILARAETKQIATLELELSELPPVECRAGEISQVVLNLIINAAHAIEAKRREGLGTITVRTRPQGDAVCIEVADDGAGIPEAVRPRLFELFFTTKPMGKGTGQGLAFAHSVIETVHGGQLRFESQEGVGTLFSIRLPIAQRTRAAA